MKITVILFRSSDTDWTLATYTGGTIRNQVFDTASQARKYAKTQGWAVRRAFSCDS